LVLSFLGSAQGRRDTLGTSAPCADAPTVGSDGQPDNPLNDDASVRPVVRQWQGRTLIDAAQSA
jgi:hypothetical protein